MAFIFREYLVVWGAVMGARCATKSVSANRKISVRCPRRDVLDVCAEVRFMFDKESRKSIVKFNWY